MIQINRFLPGKPFSEEEAINATGLECWQRRQVYTHFALQKIFRFNLRKGAICVKTRMKSTFDHRAFFA